MITCGPSSDSSSSGCSELWSSCVAWSVAEWELGTVEQVENLIGLLMLLGLRAHLISEGELGQLCERAEAEFRAWLERNPR